MLWQEEDTRICVSVLYFFLLAAGIHLRVLLIADVGWIYLLKWLIGIICGISIYGLWKGWIIFFCTLGGATVGFAFAVAIFWGPCDIYHRYRYEQTCAYFDYLEKSMIDKAPN